MSDESYVDTSCMVQVATYVYYKYLKLADVDFKKKEKKKDGANTMCGS